MPLGVGLRKLQSAVQEGGGWQAAGLNHGYPNMQHGYLLKDSTPSPNKLCNTAHTRPSSHPFMHTRPVPHPCTAHCTPKHS